MSKYRCGGNFSQNATVWLYLGDGVYKLCVEATLDLGHGQTGHQGVLYGVDRGRGGAEITGWTDTRLTVGEQFITEEVTGKEF